MEMWYALLPHLYVVCVCVHTCVSHLMSQGFSSSEDEMGTMKQWSRAHLLDFAILETWTWGPKLIFMVDIYSH